MRTSKSERIGTTMFGIRVQGDTSIHGYTLYEISACEDANGGRIIRGSLLFSGLVGVTTCHLPPGGRALGNAYLAEMVAAPHRLIFGAPGHIPKTAPVALGFTSAASYWLGKETAALLETIADIGSAILVRRTHAEFCQALLEFRTNDIDPEDYLELQDWT